MVLMNIDATDRSMARLLTSMFVIGGCVLAGLFLLSLLFSNRAIRPVEEGLRRQRQFVADASHELKTPLAIIDANAEAAAADPSEAGLWVGRIGEESGRMRGLIDDLLLLARSEDAADIPEEKLPVDLKQLAGSEIERVEAVLFERGIEVELAPAAESGYADDAPVVVQASPSRVQQVFLILLDNAMKYTPRGGRITVETGRSRRYGFFKVANTGEGISPEDMPHVFDRFYRADKARTSVQAPGAEHGGHGLGLSIAKAVTERAGGRISAASSGGVTTFTVELPL
jgi:signal transduction histidine kinase